MPSLQNETNAEKLARWNGGDNSYGRSGGSAADKRRALEGTVAIEADPATARIPVQSGEYVVLGSSVCNDLNPSAQPTATVIGYEVRPNKTYHWVGIIVDMLDGSGTQVWEWDTTVLCASVTRP